MTNDVAIIGVGLHPFGRFEGKSAMEMGVDAIFAAVADAGIEWKDIQFATGGSWTVANPDAIVGMVGLSGIPFTNVFNACATAASAAKACADGIRLGDYDIGIAIGLDKHPRGAFTEDPALVGMPSWYAENGQYLTTQFFGMKARYLHDHGVSQETLAKVAAKNFRNGALNPNAFRRKPIPEEEILNSAMLNYPPIHVLRARRGRRSGRDVPRRHRASLHVEARVSAGGRGAYPPLWRVRSQHHLRPR
jgi:acetyl-CoA C-acetyltransferase